jgi:hypothetical protein
MEDVMFRIEIEKSDGAIIYKRDLTQLVQEWRNPEDADAVAERLWNLWNGDDVYARFSVIEQDGTVYSDWEV